MIRWDEGLLDMCIGEKRYVHRPSHRPKHRLFACLPVCLISAIFPSN